MIINIFIKYYYILIMIDEQFTMIQIKSSDRENK